MKREGRQHGMVRTTYMMPPGVIRRYNNFNRAITEPATAGLFTKVTTKPNNHSKYTGKCGKARCGGCHEHPVCKSKDKTKGTHKLRSIDILANHRLVSWRVVDGRPGLNVTGFSTAEILDELASNYSDDDDENYDEDCDYDFNYVSCDNNLINNISSYEEVEHEIKEEEKKGDDDMVDEDWCLVGEIQ